MTNDAMPSDETRDEGEDGLLLREFAHRTGNVLAVVEAALRIAADGCTRPAIIDHARSRLERLGVVHRLLARPVLSETDLGSDLGALCTAMHDAAEGTPGPLEMELCDAVVDGGLARRLTLVAAELVANSHRHALGGDGSGTLSVSLRRDGGGLELIVADRAASRRPAAAGGTGLGGGIVRELVARAGGVLDVKRGDRGTTVRVSVPAVKGLSAHAV